MPTPLVFGNWKMNGTPASWRALASAIAAGGALETRGGAGITLGLFPPAPALLDVATVLERAPHMVLGAQDVAPVPDGARTGDISAAIAAACGATYTLVGHSERRAFHHEADAEVATKLKAAQQAGLTPVLCIGETLAEREMGETAAVLRAQLTRALAQTQSGAPLVVAYEPVWAIGTGKSASTGDVAAALEVIHSALETEGMGGVSVLYGGSASPKNADELATVAGLGGFLVGGASLDAESFLTVAKALEKR